MENQRVFIPLVPFKAVDESLLTQLVDSLSAISKCDENIFTQIRDFFFQISSNEFERLVQKYSNRFLNITVTLLRIPNSQTADPDNKIKKFKTNFLSCMAFLNFRFLTSKTPKDNLELLSKQINEASIEDLSNILRIIRASFDTRDPEFSKICQSLMSALNPAIKARLFDLLKDYDKVTIELLVPSLALLTMMSSSKQLMIPSMRELEKILKYECPNNISLSHMISFFTLQSKAAVMLSAMDNNTPIVPSMVRILLRTPPSISSIIDNSAAILLNYFRVDTEHRLEPMIKLFPSILDFRLITTDTLHAYFAIIQYIFEQMQSRQKFTDDALLRFCKYIASMLHFRKATFSHCSTRFNSIYSTLKIPFNSGPFRNSLISLFIFSFGIGFMEIEQQIIRMMKIMNSQKELLFAFSALLFVGESYFRLMKFLSQTIKMVSQCDMLKGKPFLAQVASPLGQVDFEQLVELLVRSLIILMKYREALQKSIEMVRFIEPSTKTTDHFKLCTQQLKAVRTYDRARNYHLHSSQEMITCIASIPANFALIVWDSFFESFFADDDNVNLDTCTFRVVITEPHVFPLFFTSITSFISKKTRSGYRLKNFLKTLQIIFEKLSIKPSAPPKNLENVDKIFREANKVIAACKEMLSDPQYCTDTLLFVQQFAVFLDFVTCNNKFTSQLFTDIFVSFVIKSASQILSSQKAVINFIAFVALKNQSILKNNNVIEFLILSLSSDFNQSLSLLNASMKQDKIKFYQHHFMPKFYMVISHFLDQSSPENKKVILKFIRKMPVKEFKNLDHVSDNIIRQRSVVLKRGDSKVVFECNSLINALRIALIDNVEDKFIWKLLIDIIDAFSMIETWDYEQHKFFHQSMLTVLHFQQKNAKIVETNFINLAKNNKNLILISHFMLSICCVYSDPPPEIVHSVIDHITDRDKFSRMIYNIITIIDILLYSTKVVLPTICDSVIQFFEPELIDPLSFSMLVHRTVIDTYSTEWIVEQHCDIYTDFVELNYLNETSLKLIKFCKQLLAGKETSVIPILSMIKFTTSLLPVLVAVEMISKNQNIDEIVNFVADFLSNKTVCYEFGDCRLLGPLSRAFPILLEKFADKIQIIVKESTNNITKMNRKHQGLVLVMLVPVLNSNAFGNIDYSAIYNICYQFLTLPSPLLKCQAQQVYHSLYKIGSDDIQLKIQQNFEQMITKSTPSIKNNFLKWATMTDIAFTYFPIFPKKVLTIAINDLEMMKSGIMMANHQSANVHDFFETVISIFSFLSSGFVVKFLIVNKIFASTAKQIIIIFNSVTYMKKEKIISLLIKFFEQSEEEFTKFFNSMIEEESIMNFFVSLINNKCMKNLFKNSGIMISCETMKKQPILSLIVLKAQLADNNDPIVVRTYIDICHKMIDAFDQNYMEFRSVVLKEIVLFFANERIEDFLQMSFHVFAVNSPLLTALFVQSAITEIDENIFMNMTYSDKDEINFAFLEAFLFPLLQNHTNWIDKIVKFLYEKFSISVFLQFINALYSQRILTKPIEYDAYEMYLKCETDEMRLQALLYWGYSKPSNFVELFKIFAGLFNVHLATELQTVAEMLKIPPEFNGNDELCNILLGLVNSFIRYPAILINVFSIYINNRETFKKIDTKMWEYVQEQSIQFASPKKAVVASYKPPFINLSRILPTSMPFSDNENALAQRLVGFVNSIVSFSKDEEKIKVETILKLRGGFLKGILNLGKMFGTKAEFNGQLIDITCEMHQKIQTSLPPTATEPVLFDMLMNSLPELVEVLAKNDDFPSFEKFIDVVFENAKSSNPAWPTALLCLSEFSDSPFYCEQFKSKMLTHLNGTTSTNELLSHSFPLLWKNPPTENFRIYRLIPFATRFCRSYNAEKPVEMLLSDSMLSIIFEFPFESSLFHIMKTCQNCIESNFDIGNKVFFTRVLVRAFSSTRKDPHLEKKLLSILENLSASIFFTAKPSPMNPEIFKKLTLRTKISSAPYLLANFKNELSEMLKKIDFKVVQKISCTKEAPVSMIISSFIDCDPTNVLKFAMNLPLKVLNSIENQVKHPIIPKPDQQYEIHIKTGINAIDYSSIELNDWKHQLQKHDLKSSSSSPLELMKLGLAAKAQIEVAKSCNSLEMVEINDILSRRCCQLDKIFDVLSIEPQPAKFYAGKLLPIIERSSYFACTENLAELMIIRQSKYFIPVINAGQKEAKPNGLFKLELSPMFDPELHQLYAELRKTMREIIARVSGKTNYPQYDDLEKVHIKNYAKSKHIHFAEKIENNLQSLIMNCQQLQQNVQKFQSQEHLLISQQIRLNSHNLIQNSDQKVSNQQINEHIQQNNEQNQQNDLQNQQNEPQNQQKDQLKQVLQQNLEIDLTPTMKENLIKGLKINNKNNIFLSAALSIFGEISSEFPKLFSSDNRIPYKWSQIFSEIGGADVCSIVHQSYRCLFAENSDMNDITTRNIRSFMQNIRTVVTEEKMKQIKEKHSIESLIANNIRLNSLQSNSQENDSNNFLPTNINENVNSMISNDETEETENRQTLMIKSLSLQPIPAPLLNDEGNQIISMTVYLTNPKNLFASVVAQLNSGVIVSYFFTPYCPMETRLLTFCNIMTSSILHKSPNCHSRGQVLLSIPSIPIGDDGFYLGKSSGEPFVASSHLKSLVDAYNLQKVDNRLLKSEKTKLNYSTQKEFCDWFWHFGVRFAALSFLQIVNDIAIFDPYQLMFDHKNAAISMISLNSDVVIKGKHDLCLLRICGKIKQMIDSPILKGPFSLGLIGAADSALFNAEKYKFFNEAILKKSVENSNEEAERIRSFSALNREVNEIQFDIGNLIQKSMECDCLFAIPWI